MSLFDSARFDSRVNGILSGIYSNDYLHSALIIFLIVYAGYAAQRLPPYILRLFDYSVVKMLIFFLIAYTANRNPTVAIIAAIGMMVTLFALNKLKLDQYLMRVTSAEQMQSLSNLNNEPIYQDMTYQDLSVHSEDLADIHNEAKDAPLSENSSCNKQGNFHNEFYPQYAQMKPDAYLARYTGNEVDGFDQTAQYSVL
jgi:hypothetical protein